MRVAIASGKGGTGKTTIATNLAMVVNRDGNRVTYADCDVEEPNGHLFLPPEVERHEDVSVIVPVVEKRRCTLCGTCSEVCEFNAIAVLGEQVLLFPSMCHSCGACVTLCPEQALRDGRRSIGFIRSGAYRGLGFVGGSLGVGEAQAPPLTKAVKRRLPREGIVIIDAPPGTSCPTVEAVRDADYVVLVTEPTPFGLNDLRLAVGMLRELQLPFGVVINRSDIGDSLVPDYCRNEGIRVLLELPFDRQIAGAYAVGRLVVEDDGEFATHMRTLYQAVLQEVTHVRARCRER